MWRVCAHADGGQALGAAGSGGRQQEPPPSKEGRESLYFRLSKGAFPVS